MIPLFKPSAIFKIQTRYVSSNKQKKIKKTPSYLVIKNKSFIAEIKGITYTFVNLELNDSQPYYMQIITTFFDSTTISLELNMSKEKKNIYELLFLLLTQKAYFKNIKEGDYFKIIQKFFQFARLYLGIKAIYSTMSFHFPQISLEPWFESNSLFLNILRSQSININSLVGEIPNEDSYNRTITLILIRIKNLEEYLLTSLTNIIDILQKQIIPQNLKQVNKDSRTLLSLYLVGQNTDNLSMLLKKLILFCYENNTSIFTKEQKSQLRSYFDKLYAILHLLNICQTLEEFMGNDSLKLYDAKYINKLFSDAFDNKFYFKELILDSTITNTQYKKLIYILNIVSDKIRTVLLFDLSVQYNDIFNNFKNYK